MQRGIALSITFLIIGGFLYFTPSYTGSMIISYSLAVFFLLIGITGLGLELNKLGGQTDKLGFDELGIGLGIGIIWAIIYYYLPVWWINLITIFLLFLSVYAITAGIIKILRILFLSKRNILVKLPIVIIQFVAFIAAIVTILDILNLI